MTEHSHLEPAAGPQAPRQGRHGWMMIACCIPMLVIAVVLVASGVVRPGFLVFAVGCTAMMGLMMRGMNHGGARGKAGNDRSGHAGHGWGDKR